MKRSAPDRAEPTARRRAAAASPARSVDADAIDSQSVPQPVVARERNRAETTARILAAVGEVLARDGFGALGVNAVAKHAGVDKVLIYRYFGGMSELLKAWGESGRFWPGVDELVGADPTTFFALSLAERYARFFEHFIDGLRSRPLTLEIMAAELTERNELTAILETEREEWGAEASRLLGGDAWARGPALRGTTLLLVAGVQYLLIRSRTIRLFGGLDIRSDGDWTLLKASVRQLALDLLGDETLPAPQPEARPSPPPTSRRTRAR
ncbi:MAG: helix-turn-helix domain-containing protein [Caldimonas sp.]